MYLKTVNHSQKAILPDNIAFVPEKLFYRCEALTTVKLPSKATWICDSAFTKCKSLQNIDLSNITEIGEYAFDECASLTSLKLSAGLRNIEEGTFHECTSLTEVKLPDDILTIEYEAFCNCTALKSITLPKNLAHIDYNVLYKCTSLNTVYYKGNKIEVTCINETPVIIKSSTEIKGCIVHKCIQLDEFLHEKDDIEYVVTKDNVSLFSDNIDLAISNLYYEISKQTSKETHIQRIKEQGFLSPDDYRALTSESYFDTKEFLKKNHLDWNSSIKINDIKNLTDYHESLNLLMT